MLAIRMSSISKVLGCYSVRFGFSVLKKNATNLKSNYNIFFHTSTSFNVKGQQITMPSLSPTMSEGKIVKWLKKEGDTINPGDVLCDIETDKAIVSLETEEEGILAKILVDANNGTIDIGTPIALMVLEGEDWRLVEDPLVEVGENSSASSKSTDFGNKEISDKTDKTYGPAVRSLLSIYEIDPSLIKASGKNNVILKEDVLKYVEENKLQRKPPKPISLPPSRTRGSESITLSSTSSLTAQDERKPGLGEDQSNKILHSQRFGRRSKQKYVDIEASNVRRVIAKRLTESKFGIPHAYCNIRCQVDNLLNVRKELNNHGIKASLNDYVIKAAACALENCAKVNGIWVNNEYKHLESIDIAVAVATSNGLITPIVQNVAEKTVSEISQNARELAVRAREGKLKPHEFQGGSFTISNLGMFGVKNFTAIINPPQIAILAVGAAFDRFGPDRKTHKDVIFNLSYDRRALNEDEAAEFLESFKFVVENPKKLVAKNISATRYFNL